MSSRVWNPAAQEFTPPRTPPPTPPNGTCLLDLHLLNDEDLIIAFYEALFLSVALGKTRGARIEAPSFCSERLTKLREFLTGLAFVCDYSNHGHSVTGIAVEQQRNVDSVVYHFACNHAESTTKIEAFLRDTLSKLADTTKTRIDLEKEILALILDHDADKIKRYKNRINEDIEILIRNMSHPFQGNPRHRYCNFADDQPLYDWLLELEGSLSVPNELLRFCHNERYTMHQFCNNYKDNKNLDRVTRIIHVVKQISRIMVFVKACVQACHEFPELFQSYTISKIPSSRGSTAPLTVGTLTVRGIVERILQVPAGTRLPDYEIAIKKLEAKNLRTKLGDGWSPIVHAEILIADHFHKTGLDFFENDRYIACSKAACYCCYYFLRQLSHHPGQFVEPGCHYNAYIRWRLPDIDSDSGPEILEHQRRFLIDTIPQMHREILDQLSGIVIPRQRTDSAY